MRIIPSINHFLDPILSIEAETEAEMEQLTMVFEGLKAVQLVSITTRKSGIYNVCGSSHYRQKCESLCIPVALGGIGLGTLEAKSFKKRNRMNKMSDISEETFAMLLNYSRFQIDLREDVKAMHDIELEKDRFPNPDELVQARESDAELTEEQWKEILDIIAICEQMKAKDEALRDLDIPDNRPIFYDENGYAYRLSDSWEGRPTKDYIEMGN